MEEQKKGEGISSRIAEALRRTDAPLIGRVLPEGIELKGLLGGGATADTYLGERRGLPPKHFAVKVFKPWVLRTKGESERIEREVVTMRGISHKNLMRVYGFGVDDTAQAPLVYLLNEYLDGPSLRSFLDEYKSLRFESVADLMAQLCDGVAHLHAKGIIHRDIKPENIVVISKAEYSPVQRKTFTLKLLDFGVVKSLDDKELTETDFFLGTVRYAAPEWIQGKGDSPSLDLYSIGMVLYRMLYGKDPYADLGKNRAKIEYAILSGKGIFSATPAPLSELKDEESEWKEFFRILGAWLTQQDSSNRPENIGEMYQAFSEGINGKWWKSKISNDFMNWINSSNFSLRFPDDLSYRGERKGKYREEGELIRNFLTLRHAILSQDCVEAFETKIYEGLSNEVREFVVAGRFSRADAGGIIEGMFSELRMDRGLENPFGDAVTRPTTWDKLLISWFEDYGFFDWINNKVANGSAQSIVNPIMNRCVREFSNGDTLLQTVLPSIRSAKEDWDDAFGSGFDYYYDYVNAAECCLRASKFCLVDWLEEFLLARAIAYYEASLVADGRKMDSNVDLIMYRPSDIERGNWLAQEERIERGKKLDERHDKYIHETIGKLENELRAKVSKNNHPLPIIEKDRSDGKEKLSQRPLPETNNQFKFVARIEDGLIVGLSFEGDRNLESK